MAESALPVSSALPHRRSFPGRARNGWLASALGCLEGSNPPLCAILFLMPLTTAGFWFGGRPAGTWPEPMHHSGSPGQGAGETSGSHLQESGADNANQPGDSQPDSELSISSQSRLPDEANERLLLARTEQTGLVLLAVCGTIAIGWSCLMLDHLTRHHFSRRFQTIAALVWILFVAAIVWLFASLAT
jgi:hypothetical protein